MAVEYLPAAAACRESLAVLDWFGKTGLPRLFALNVLTEVLGFEVRAMAGSWQVTCVTATTGSNTYDRIERVGGPDGEGWTLHVDEVIAHINKGTSFWVDIAGQRVDVIVASHSGRAYIKTRSDANSSNYLLSLPECVE